MTAPEPTWVTWAVRIGALLGTVTGTLSLLLTFRAHRRDRCALALDVYYVDSWRSSFPPEIALRVRVRNVGRRPAGIDSVMVRVPPKAQSLGLRMGKWVPVQGFSVVPELSGWDDPRQWSLRTIGEAGTITLSIDEHGLPVGTSMSDIIGVLVVDTAGNRWRSRPDFGQARVREILSAKPVRMRDFGPSEALFGLELGRRSAALVAYRLSEEYLLHLKWAGAQADAIYMRTSSDRLDQDWNVLEDVAADYVACGLNMPDKELAARQVEVFIPSRLRLL